MSAKTSTVESAGAGGAPMSESKNLYDATQRFCQIASLCETLSQHSGSGVDISAGDVAGIFDALATLADLGYRDLQELEEELSVKEAKAVQP